MKVDYFQIKRTEKFSNISFKRFQCTLAREGNERLHINERSQKNRYIARISANGSCLYIILIVDKSLKFIAYGASMFYLEDAIFGLDAYPAYSLRSTKKANSHIQQKTFKAWRVEGKHRRHYQYSATTLINYNGSGLYDRQKAVGCFRPLYHVWPSSCWAGLEIKNSKNDSCTAHSMKS